MMAECRTGGRTEEGTAFAALSSISNSGICTQLPLRHCILHTCYLAGVDLAASSLTPPRSSLVFAAAACRCCPTWRRRSVLCCWTGLTIIIIPLALKRIESHGGGVCVRRAGSANKTIEWWWNEICIVCTGQIYMAGLRLRRGYWRSRVRYGTCGMPVPRDVWKRKPDQKKKSPQRSILAHHLHSIHGHQSSSSPPHELSDIHTNLHTCLTSCM
jgi:hypothetical protein